MIRNFVYWICSTAALGLLVFAAPSGALLTAVPQRGTVERDAQGRATIRGTGSTFVWLGGGYQGGK